MGLCRFPAVGTVKIACSVALVLARYRWPAICSAARDMATCACLLAAAAPCLLLLILVLDATTRLPAKKIT